MRHLLSIGALALSALGSAQTPVPWVFHSGDAAEKVERIANEAVGPIFANATDEWMSVRIDVSYSYRRRKSDKSNLSGFRTQNAPPFPAWLPAPEAPYTKDEGNVRETDRNLPISLGYSTLLPGNSVWKWHRTHDRKTGSQTYRVGPAPNSPFTYQREKLEEFEVEASLKRADA